MTQSKFDGAHPLLSICLPVYNGADYLPNVLSALLPQSDELRDLVEVIVADDASQDASRQICAEAAAGDRLRYICNSPNLGMGPNIARCITEHARGQYVWIWSQHCLLRPGKLRFLVDLLLIHADVDVAYVNFRCAVYPEKWPQSCLGGFDGSYDYTSNPSTENRLLSAWHQLLNPQTCLCTQTYAHIVNRNRAASFLMKQQIVRDFGAAISTFTQTTSTASVFFDDKVLYIGDPVFTIFNGAQTWSKPRSRALVYFLALPELVGIYRRRGLPSDSLAAAEIYASQMAGESAVELLKAGQYAFLFKMLVSYYWNSGRQKGSISFLASTVCLTEWCWASRHLLRILASIRVWRLYFLVNWRPARWIRSILQNSNKRRGENT